MKYFFQYRADGTVVSFSDKKLSVENLNQAMFDITEEQRASLLQNPVVTVVNGQLNMQFNEGKQAKHDFVQKVKNGTVTPADIITLLEKIVV